MGIINTLWMVWIWQQPIQTILLDYNKPISLDIYGQRNITEEQIIICDEYVLFFSMNGELIKEFGKIAKSKTYYQKPTSFVMLPENKIGLFNNNTRVLSVYDFDSEEHIRSFNLNGSQIFENISKNTFYLLTLGRNDWASKAEYTQHAQSYNKPILKELIVQKNSIKQGPPFHKASNMIKRWAFDDSYHHIKQYSNLVYVLDELEPTLKIYDNKTGRLRNSQALLLKGFTPAPKNFPNVVAMTKNQYREWFYSFSRFLDLNVREKKLLISYLVPNSSAESIYEQHVTTLDKRFRTIDDHTIEGHYTSDLFYIRSNENRYGTIRDIGKEWPKYEIKVYQW